MQSLAFKSIFILMAGFSGFLSSSLEARSLRTPLCVSISEIAGAGREMGKNLSGLKGFSDPAKKIVKTSNESAKEIKAWYDSLRVSREAVLVKIEF